MATGKMVERRGDTRDSYLDLIRLFPLRPIKNKRELDHAVRVIDSLLDKDKLDPGEADYLDVISDIVERYETQKETLPSPSDRDMLTHLLDAKGITQAEAARATRIANSTLSEINAGKRKFTRGHIAKLAEYFHVPPSAFFG